MKNFCCTLFATLFAMEPSAQAVTPSAASQSTISSAAQMVIRAAGSTASAKGPEQFFTGPVRVDMLQPTTAPSRTSVGAVTFEPGSRSAWHTHPLGQTLIVMTGTGWVQQEGAAKQLIKPGDVIWTPPGVKHWHGATSTTGMTHYAITEALDGKNVDWMEKVSDEIYIR